MLPERAMASPQPDPAPQPQPQPQPQPRPQLLPRQCGRCRQMFEGDPDLEPGTIADWWVCATCRLVLLPPARR